MLDPLLIVELGVLGLATGFLAGLLGIGGGMLLVPFMTYLLGSQQVAPDLAVKMAIATSMATIMFTSVSSVRAHHKRGAVRWDIVRRLAPGIVLGGFIASLGLFALLKGSFLAIFFALFVSFSAVQMFLDKKPAPTRQMPSGGGQVAAGGVIGFLSGLVGDRVGGMVYLIACGVGGLWYLVRKWMLAKQGLSIEHLLREHAARVVQAPASAPAPATTQEKA